MKHNANPVTVKGIKADAGKTEVKFEENTDYTLNIDTNGTMTVDFGAKKSDKFQSVAGGKIIITYTATVQSGAIVPAKPAPISKKDLTATSPTKSRTRALFTPLV